MDYEIKVDLEAGDRRAVVRLGRDQLVALLAGRGVLVDVAVERDDLTCVRAVLPVEQAAA